jgi:hypothetical protein
VIIRAIGPPLIENGVADALLDPRLDVYDSNGTLKVSNDDWRTDRESSIAERGCPERTTVRQRSSPPSQRAPIRW